jgi:hypothetical protein
MWKTKMYYVPATAAGQAAAAATAASAAQVWEGTEAIAYACMSTCSNQVESYL